MTRSALHHTGTKPAAVPVTAGGVPTKPRLRGWLHAAMTPVMLVAILALMVRTDSRPGRAALAIYLVTALLLFGNSAAYHRIVWSRRVSALLRRFDHSNIALFIAGTYTPLAVLLLTGAPRVTLLGVVWGCALAEVVSRNLWMEAPRMLYTGLYIAMGCAAVGWLPQLWQAGGPAVVLLIAVGGLFYILGAIVYALRKPDPWPSWFGFHELFHTGTVIGALCHFAAIWVAVGR
ncbi:hemolysin III [Propionibacterium cyclohexanicum]|uniref:Hemolysin III n=1 Tax=Propionibacterium cyclohexanicum TaxID=64702 RepID=A0A1H9RFY0_9ACTN|nr:hemolysin III family protein [Propionibacterium cyclohexanicum]SER71666.1 hemolysin III [Propionibacterium cyclohexanicum]